MAIENTAHATLSEMGIKRWSRCGAKNDGHRTDSHGVQEAMAIVG